MSAAGRKKSKPGAILAILGVAVFLMVLMNYLLNFDYNPREIDDEKSLPSMRGSLSVVEWPVNGSLVPCASLTLTNAGTSSLTLLDTETLEPLYDYELQKRLANGQLDPLPRAPQFNSIQVIDEQKEARKAEVILLPGRSMTVYLPLSPAYDLRGASGTYHVTVHYRPDAALKMMRKEDAGRLNVRPLTLSCQLDFELPLRRPEPAKSAAPKEAITVEPSKRAPPPMPVEAPGLAPETQKELQGVRETQ